MKGEPANVENPFGSKKKVQVIATDCPLESEEEIPKHAPKTARGNTDQVDGFN